MSHVSVETLVPLPQLIAFEALSRPELYSKLVPKDTGFTLVSPRIKMQKGAEYEFKYSRFGISQLLGLRVVHFQSPVEIQFELNLGVFKSYSHTIRCDLHDPQTTKVTHFVNYDLPLGIIGKIYDDLHLRKYLKKTLLFVNKQLPSVSTGSK